MAEQTTNKLTFRDAPIIAWLIGLVFTGLGVYLLFQQQGVIPAIICLVVGLALLFLIQTSVVTADRDSAILTVVKRNLLGSKVQQIRFEDISSVMVDSHRSYDEGHSSTTYRLSLSMKDGSLVPLQGFYSSGSASKEARARKLQAFIGLPEEQVQLPVSGRQVLEQLMKPGFTLERSGTDANVSWQLEKTGAGGLPIFRWHAPAVTLPEGFLYLVQGPHGQKNLFGGGVLAGVSKMLYEQSIRMYGFTPADTPGLETAVFLQQMDSRLKEDFTGLASSERLADQALDPWAAGVLAEWARRYPASQLQNGNQLAQLVVLFSPNGLYLAGMGLAPTGQLEGFIQLGVDLAKTQG